MGGDAYNSKYERATKYEAWTNMQIANTQGKYDVQVAQTQSQAVVAQARYDYMARIHEADTNKDVQMKALDVREKEAKLQFQVDWKNAQNDAIRAEASTIAAEGKKLEGQAKVDKAQASMIREEGRAERDRNRYGDRTSDYWYGQ